MNSSVSIDPKPRSRSASKRGFSMIELLISMTILVVMLMAASTMVASIQRIWTSSQSRTSQFRDARLAFELITRNLTQATLNTYWDYVYDADENPIDYDRRSELHFFTGRTDDILGGDQYPAHCVFFQAILGFTRDESLQQLDTLLNGRGYYIQFSDDDFEKPRFLSSLDNQSEPRWRFRLMEYLPPAERNLVYHSDRASREDGSPMKKWFSPELIAEHSRPVVDNVIALIISPQTSPDSRNPVDNVHQIAPSFTYDSRNESKRDTFNLLPPLVQVTLIAIDETSAMRLQDASGETSPPSLIQSDWFQKAANLTDDLEKLEEEFQKEKINYRIFTTTIAIRSAKWSQ